MGSSRYATGAPSRRITPWRLGFGRAASAFEALADADSVRSGLKRLRLAMVPNAPPDRSVAAGAAAVAGTGAPDARPPGGSVVWPATCQPLDAIRPADAPTSRALSLSHCLDIRGPACPQG